MWNKLYQKFCYSCFLVRDLDIYESADVENLYRSGRFFGITYLEAIAYNFLLNVFTFLWNFKIKQNKFQILESDLNIL